MIYLVGDFDLLVSNTSNAFYLGNTIEGLEIVEDDKKLHVLYDYYNVDNQEQLMIEANNDFRFVIPEDIAVKGVIPRAPYVKLTDDPNWTTIDKLESRLLKIVERKRNERKKR